MNSNNAYVIDTFLANSLQSTNLTVQNIRSRNILVHNLTLDGSIQHLNPNANNYNYESVKVLSNDPWKQGWVVNNKAFSMDDKEQGVLLSNGKIALISSFDYIDVQKTQISTNLQFTDGVYASNTIEPFYVNKINVFHYEDIDSQVITKGQSLDLKNSILTSNYKVVNKVDGNYVNIDCDLFVCRSLPFSTMQNITVRKGNQDLDTFDLFHQVYGKGNLSQVVFNNNILYDKFVSDGIYVLSGEGIDKKGSRVAFASCYSFSDPNVIKNKGFNVHRNDANRCFNTFSFDFSSSSSNSCTLNIFSSIMTDADSEHPLSDVKRLVMTIFASGLNPVMAMQKIRTNHIQEWNTVWKTNVVINPKKGIPVEGEKDIAMLNKYIKTSLYNIFSISKKNNVIDQKGVILNNGDIWIIPLFLLIKPEIGKTLLEYRFKTFHRAQQFAESYGYGGSQFEYVSDNSNLYWNVNSPVFVFNNALIAINIWNYYRASKDREWLDTKGYPVLKAITELFVSLIDFNPANDSYSLKNTIGFNGVPSVKNNTFTNNMVKLAIGFTIEASYELTYTIKDVWKDIYFSLPLLYISGSRDILKYDANSIEEDTYNILDMLFVLIPYFSKIYFSFDNGMGIYHNPQSIIKNIEYYINKIKTRYVNHPYNLGLLGILYGLYAQYDESYVQQFNEQLKKISTFYIQGVWNNMTGFNTKDPANSIDLNCILLHIILQGIVDLKISGGVAETRFYYEEFKVFSNKSANMPNHWQNIKMTSTENQLNNTTTNNLLYIASTQKLI